MGRKNILTEQEAKELHDRALANHWNYVKTAKESGMKPITLYKTWRKFAMEMPNHRRRGNLSKKKELLDEVQTGGQSQVC